MIITTIKEYRKNLNISQEQLAKRVGVNQSYISKLEHNEMRHASFFIIEKIAKVLNVCPVVLIDGCYRSKCCNENCTHYKDKYTGFNKLPKEGQREFLQFIKYLEGKYHSNN